MAIADTDAVGHAEVVDATHRPSLPTGVRGGGDGADLPIPDRTMAVVVGNGEVRGVVSARFAEQGQQGSVIVLQRRFVASERDVGLGAGVEVALDPGRGGEVLGVGDLDE